MLCGLSTLSISWCCNVLPRPWLISFYLSRRILCGTPCCRHKPLNIGQFAQREWQHDMRHTHRNEQVTVLNDFALCLLLTLLQGNMLFKEGSYMRCKLPQLAAGPCAQKTHTSTKPTQNPNSTLQSHELNSACQDTSCILSDAHLAIQLTHVLTHCYSFKQLSPQVTKPLVGSWQAGWSTTWMLEHWSLITKVLWLFAKCEVMCFAWMRVAISIH